MDSRGRPRDGPAGPAPAAPTTLDSSLPSSPAVGTGTDSSSAPPASSSSAVATATATEPITLDEPDEEVDTTAEEEPMVIWNEVDSIYVRGGEALMGVDIYHSLLRDEFLP